MDRLTQSEAHIKITKTPSEGVDEEKNELKKKHHTLKANKSK